MIAKIVEINYPKIKIEKFGKIKEYEVEEFVQESFIKLGPAEISFNDDTKKISFIKMEQTEEKSSSQPSKSQDDIVNIKGKDFMTYEGLLKKAHDKNPNFSMVILESHVSEDMTMAWCKVRLTAGIKGSLTDLQTFDGIGSSTPINTGIMVQDHPIELANTRAKGRALRDFLNIGQVMELKK